MSDPTQTPAAVDAAPEKTPEQFADVQASRDRAKAKLKEAEASHAAQGEELAKLRAQAEERTSADAAAKLESDTEAGRWKEVIGTKDERIETLLKQQAEQTAEHQAFRDSTVRQTRVTGLVDAIAEKLPGVDRFTLGATLQALGSRGVDIAPESITADSVDIVLSKLKESAPTLFVAPAQRPPPRNGAGIPQQPTNDVSHWVDVMKRATGAQ